MTLLMIGRQIPKNAKWPPDVDTLEKGLASIDVAYHLNHRGGEIGSYRFEKTSANTAKMVCRNPYPCDFDLGLIDAVAHKFKPDNAPIFMMIFMMRGCMRKMKHMMAGSQSAGQGGAGMEMAHCPCMTMMGRFMRGPASAKEEKDGQSK